MCTFLWWMNLLIVNVLRLAVADFCAREWIFHEKTFTCMKVIKEKRNFQYSHEYCCTVGGHLVFIFDKETDDFLKDLLNAKNVNAARIGLNDAIKNGQYYWHWNKQDKPMTYSGFKSETSRNNSKRTTVTTSQDGWVEIDRHDLLYFVCQVEAELPKPEITCPSLVPEHSDTSVSCSVKVTRGFPVTDFSFNRLGTRVAFIKNSVVNASQGYNIFLKGDSNTQVATLVITSVNRLDEAANWTCSVQYNNTKETHRQRCLFDVYAVPSAPVCSYNFTKNKINLFCNTTSVYPGGKCSFYLDSNIVGYSYVEPIEDEILRCNLSYKLTSDGTHTVTVQICPVKYNTGVINEGCVVSGNLTFLVEKPRQHPILQQLNGQAGLLSDSLTVTENTTISLSCSVTGGQPPVYRTLLKCGGQTEAAAGESVKAEFQITRSLHQTQCICWAEHIAGYNKQTTITLFVEFPSEVVEVKVEHTKHNISRGDKVKISCPAKGYPPPQVSLLDPEGRTLSTNESYTLTATCHSAGTYKCRAENNVAGFLRRHEVSKLIKIHCFPEHCDPRQTVPELGVAVGEEAIISLCVVTHPLYQQVAIYKGNNSYGTELQDFQYSMNYTDEVRQKAVIHIVKKLVGPEDLGFYTMCGNTCSINLPKLQFRLIAKGPPMCPTNFSAAETDSIYVVLSWIPGFDGGRQQNFTILRYHTTSEEAVIPVNSSSSQPTLSFEQSYVAQIPHNNHKEMFYNLSGLSASTKYMFGIQASNDVNTTNCPLLNVLISTQALSSEMYANSSIVNILIPVLVCLAVILVLVLVVLIRRRRQQKSLEVPVQQAGDMQDTQEVPRHDVTTRSASDQDTDITYYNTKNSVPTEEPVYINKYPQEELNTYAQVVKTKKVNKPKHSWFVKKNHQLEEDNGYIQFDQRQEALKLNNRQNNTVYETYTAPGLDNTGESVDKLYSNSAVLKPKNKKKPPKPQRKEEVPSRTVTQDGLIYIDVEINKKTSNPVLLEGDKTRTGPTPRKAGPVTQKPPEDVVEYMAVDFNAGRTTATE